jgi:SPX domain protein involved in polyphosphate accumulation
MEVPFPFPRIPVNKGRRRKKENMAIEVFNRFEHKYLMDHETFVKATRILEQHMNLDYYNKNHKPYTIANIYYDTEDDHLIRTSLTKPTYKEKLRLRAYGVPDMTTLVFLEIKKKYRGLVNKRRTTLNLKEAYQFVDTGEIPSHQAYMNQQVLQEIHYFLNMYDLKPKLYLAYDRIAYFEKDNPDLRISFDHNIRSRRYDVSLEKGDYGEPLLDDDLWLMEIKTARAKPLWLTKMMTDLGIHRHSFSKYGTEFKNYITT